MRIPLAGGVDETIMSEVSAVILPFFSMAEATALRLVCREFLEPTPRCRQRPAQQPPLPAPAPAPTAPPLLLPAMTSPGAPRRASKCCA